jgi:hemolysin activation/secretion protein
MRSFAQDRSSGPAGLDKHAGGDRHRCALPLARWLAGAVLSVTAPFGTSAWAQPNDPPVGQARVDEAPTIDRDRLDRQDPSLPRAVPSVSLPQARAPVASANVASAQPLTRVRFEGSTLPPEALARATAPFAGAPIDAGTLQKLANAISALYGQSDIAFYAVSIPAQTASGGVLTVRVVEGRVATYTIGTPTRSTPTRLIDAQLQPLLRDKPAHRSRIERTLSLLRDIPGQTVEANVRRTAVPDELALDLDVKRKQVEVTVNVNNRGVVNVVSGVQAQVGVAVHGALREGDSTRVSAYLPFQPSRYQFYSASHATPIGAAGTTLGFSGAYVRTRTRVPEVRGEAEQFAMVVAHPLIRSYKRNLSLNISLDGTNSDNYFLDTAFGGFRTRTLRAGASWSVVENTDGYAASVSVSQGLNTLGARRTIGYSETGYRKANMQLVGVKQVAEAISVKMGVRGQYTRDRLPTTERFALGGEGAGIAFQNGIVTADKALAADAEVTFRLKGRNPLLKGLALFAYADGVTARSYARPDYRLVGQSYSVATAGGGIRFTPVKDWSASAQLAVPIKTPSGEFPDKARVFFSISKSV